MQKFIAKYGHALAAIALFITMSDVAQCCFFILHQPELPQEAKKLRRF